jgi:hypothetical protein
MPQSVCITNFVSGQHQDVSSHHQTHLGAAQTQNLSWASGQSGEKKRRSEYFSPVCNED